MEFVPNRTTNVVSAVEAQARSIVSEMRANVLIEGVEGDINRFLVGMIADLDEPVSMWASGPLPTAGTLLVLNVDHLDGSEQAQLLEWLTGTASRVQVVSTCSKRLFALVQSAAFSRDLYYRLNVVRVTL